MKNGVVKKKTGCEAGPSRSFPLCYGAGSTQLVVPPPRFVVPWVLAVCFKHTTSVPPPLPEIVRTPPS